MNMRRRRVNGFTLVELLIVIVVIAILAAITIVAYNGVRDRAITSAMQGDLSQDATLLQTFSVTNGGFPVDQPSAVAAGIEAGNGTNLTYIGAADGSSFCLYGVNGSHVYSVTDQNNTPDPSICGGSTGSFTSIAATTMTFNWTAVAGATGYNAKCAKDAAFTNSPFTTNTANVSWAISGLVGATTYYCASQAVIGGSTSGWSSTVSVLTLPATPATPGYTALTSTGFTLTWSAITGATSYGGACSTSTAYTTTTGLNNGSLTGTSTAVTGLTAGTTYYCRLRANDATGPSAWSGNLTIQATPAVPGSVAATAITGTGFTLGWGAVTGSTGYQAQCSTDSAYGTTNFSNTSIASGTTSVAVTGLTVSTLYYCHVSAKGSQANSAYSANISVTTAAS